MHTLAQRVYLDSEFGVESELPRVASALENPYVFDASARELQAMADRGLIEIVERRVGTAPGGTLIDRMTFRRLR